MSDHVVRVRVEFYGIARARSGVADSVVDLSAPENTLGALFQQLEDQFPGLSECFDGPCLRRGFMASMGGDRFVTSPAAVIHDGDVVLVLSADAGG